MHIYTMGTRHYAEAVAHVIDPDQSLFKERILSRDDSGSFEIKSIKRLFPCNEGMVVVVDDRGDVWKWPSNLIKVRPYNFFVGSGDINEPIYAASQIVSNVKEHVPPTPMLDKKDLDLIILAELKDEDDGNDDKNVMQTLNIVQDHGFEKIVNERPLLQEVTRIENARVGHRPRPVLRDDDKELDIVFNVLNNVHATYYHNLEHDPTAADSRLIMDDMRKILVGVVIVFSSVIPLDSDPTDSDIWKRAISAGAQCVTELNRNVTHVVSAKVVLY